MTSRNTTRIPAGTAAGPAADAARDAVHGGETGEAGEAAEAGTAGKRALPLSALLALATAVFITSLTETLPAGLLPAMSADLGVGESTMGQTVTVYAIGTALTAIPLTAATAGWRRKRLLLAAMAGFAVANTVTALSGSYPLTMAARFAAGVAAASPGHCWPGTPAVWCPRVCAAGPSRSPWPGFRSPCRWAYPPGPSSAPYSAGGWPSSP